METASREELAMNECILVVDDDREIVGAIAIVLEREGYTVRRAYDGLGAVEQALDPAVRLILIDVMMPKLDGLSALMRIREKRNLPVIVLSAKSEDTDKILGLNVGADDYITKPFNPLEVAARVNSQLRRYTKFGAEIKQTDTYIIGGIELNDQSKTVTADGEPVSLTPKEYDILKLLIASPGKVFSPKEIYNLVWKESPLTGNDNTVAVHIRHLREKIEINPNDPRYIKVIFGQGYKMEKGRSI